MVVKRRFSSVAQEVAALDYVCEHCDHRDRAWVRGVGGASRDTGIVELRAGSDDALRDELALEAGAAADANAVLTLEIAPCPKCNAPGPQAGPTKQKYAARAAVFASIGLALGAASALARVWAGAAVFPLVGLLFGWLVWHNHKWIWETAASRVHFASRDGALDARDLG